MTSVDEPVVIDAEVEEETRPLPPFRVISHKPSLAAMFAPFGATTELGVTVNAEEAPRSYWWMSQDWAAKILQAGIELPQLLAPPPMWLAGLGEDWLNRKVTVLRKRDISSFYAKNPGLVEEYPTVVVSTPGEYSEVLPPRLVPASDLAGGKVDGFDHLPGVSWLQLDQIMPCVVEARFWVADNEITTFSPYRIGTIGWDSSLFLEMTFNIEGQQLLKKAEDHVNALLDERAPEIPGYVLDVGVAVDGTPTILRALPSWSAEPLGADPDGVYESLAAAHDFEGIHYEWRWSPDLFVYDRSHLAEPETAVNDDVAIDTTADTDTDTDTDTTEGENDE